MKSPEVDLAHAEWVKSSYSGPEGGECVESSLSFVASRLVPVRDSKNLAGPALLFPLGQWTGFVTAIKRGDV